MRKVVNILCNLSSTDPKSKIKNSINVITPQDIHSPTHKSLMNMLHENSPGERHDRAKFKSEVITNNKRYKVHITDADKILCKVIISSLQNLSKKENQKHMDPILWCKQSEEALSCAIKRAKTNLTTRKKQLHQIQIEKNKSAKHIIAIKTILLVFPRVPTFVCLFVCLFVLIY